MKHFILFLIIVFGAFGQTAEESNTEHSEISGENLRDNPIYEDIFEDEDEEPDSETDEFGRLNVIDDQGKENATEDQPWEAIEAYHRSVRPSGINIKGRILDEYYYPVAGTIVRMFPVNYIPSDKEGLSNIPSDTTDENGDYSIYLKETGLYNLKGSKDNFGIFRDSINISTNISDVSLADAILKRMGKIVGQVQLAGKYETINDNVILYIPGSGWYQTPNFSGKFIFNLIPAGHYQLTIIPTVSGFHVKILEVTVKADAWLDLKRFDLEQKDDRRIINIKKAKISGIWGPNKIYKIYSDLIIPDAHTLQIERNTKVIFMDNYRFIVSGSLFINGDVWGRVILTTGKKEPIPNSWTFEGQERLDGMIHYPDEILIKFAIIEYARIGFMAYVNKRNASRITITNSVFRYNAKGVSFKKGYIPPMVEQISIQHSIFHDNETGIDYQLYAGGAKILIENSILLNNSLLAINTDAKVIVFENHNCFFNNQKINNNPYTAVERIIAYPKFVNFGKGIINYHLEENSPCKGTGGKGANIGVF